MSSAPAFHVTDLDSERMTALLDHARTDPRLLGIARTKFAQMAPDLFEERKPHLSLSNAGSCALSLWAELHGKNDIPDGSFYARDRGTLMGAWYAALLGTALYEGEPRLHPFAEFTLQYDGVPGHADLALYDAPDASGFCLAVIDFKTTGAFQTPEPHESKKDGTSDIHYCLQVAAYALSLGAPWFAIARFLGGGRLVVSWYETASWKPAVDAEVARLRTAEKDEAPAPDPRAAWLCESCRFSGCARNRNPRRSETPLAALLEASLPAGASSA
jgi:hypothetical protein